MDYRPSQAKPTASNEIISGKQLETLAPVSASILIPSPSSFISVDPVGRRAGYPSAVYTLSIKGSQPVRELSKCVKSID